MFPKHTPSKFLAIALTGIFLTNIYVTNIAFAERTLSDVVQAGQSRTDDAAATQTQVNELVTSTDGLKNDFIEIRKVVNDLTTYNDLLLSLIHI